MTPPTITAGVRVHNAELFIAETLTAILSQTRPPEEIVVVDDGSTDGTPEELERFAREVRIVRQPNRGLAATFNRVFDEARGDYVAMCDADDIWSPDRLERQAQALVRHPEIGIAFGAVEIFGTASGPWGYLDILEPGILQRDRFARALLRADVVSTSTTLIARRLYGQVGPFRERMGAEDYDYWLRALKTGAVFYYDPATLARYRRHSDQVTSSMLRVEQSGYQVRLSHGDLVADRRFLNALLATNLFDIGRLLVDEGRRTEAGEAFRRCLRHHTPATLEITARALAWMALLALPRQTGLRGSEALIRLSRAFDGLRGGRPETLA